MNSSALKYFRAVAAALLLTFSALSTFAQSPQSPQLPGKLDLSFAGEGYRVDGIGQGGQVSYASAMQPDGKIVAVGRVYNDVAVARYNVDGSLDLTFGKDGKVFTRFSSAMEEALAVALQADGKVVVAGYVTNANKDFLVMRYTAAGKLDTTFDGDGIVTLNLGAADQFQGVAIQPDGKIVAIGESSSNVTVRFNTDGSLDPTFDSDGILVNTYEVAGVPFAVKVQADGKILTAGYFLGDFGVIRYNPNGSFDAAFGGTGIVFTPGTDTAYALAIQPDGKIVAGGTADSDFAVARYNTDGSPDTTFDGDGKMINSIDAGPDQIRALALQSDGKIVAAGQSQASPTTNTNFALARYDSNGSLDTTFNGTGSVIAPVSTNNRPDYANSVLVRADGTIVTTGTANISSGDNFTLLYYAPNGQFTSAVHSNLSFAPAYGKDVLIQPDGKIVVTVALSSPITAVYHFAFIRYDPDGSRDTSFGNNGSVQYAHGDRGEVNALAIQPDGKIVAAGFGNDLQNPRGVIMRLNADGTPDATFNGSGSILTTFGGTGTGSNETGAQVNQIAIAPDGKIVVTGFRTAAGTGGMTHNIVARYNSDGSPDTSFDGDGYVTNTSLVLSSAATLLLQPDGKVIVGGRSSTHFGLVRFNTDGSLDSSFGTGGGVTTPMGTSSSSLVSLKLLADGRILAGGGAVNGTNNDFALARYQANGTLDTSFDGDGKLLTQMGIGNDTLSEIALQTDGKIVAAGYASNIANTDIALVRYNIDGSIDTAYGTNGKAILDTGEAERVSGMALDDRDRAVVVGITWNLVTLRFRSDNQPLVNVAGRLMSVNGNPIANVTVVMSDENLNTRFVLSNGFGYYNFTGVPEGAGYTISLSSKRFTFSPESQTVGVTGAVLDVDFLGTPNEGRGAPAVTIAEPPKKGGKQALK